jgi:hypothetical protein
MGIEVKGAAYYSFSVLLFITSVLGLQAGLRADVEQVLSSIEGYRVIRVIFEMFLEFGSEMNSLRADKGFSEVVEMA